LDAAAVVVIFIFSERLQAIDQAMWWMKCVPAMVPHGMGIRWTQMVAAFATRTPKPITQTGLSSVFTRCLLYGIGILANHTRAEMSKTMMNCLSSISVVVPSVDELMSFLGAWTLFVLFAYAVCAAAILIVRDAIQMIMNAFFWIVIFALGAIDVRLGIAVATAWYIVDSYDDLAPTRRELDRPYPPFCHDH
jgi:hypothetical protein